MTSTLSAQAYRASAMLRRIRRLEALPAFRPQPRVRWLHMDHRPQVAIKRNEHWVIDVLDDTDKPKGRWRRSTDPNDKGMRPTKIPTIYYHWGFNEDENVIYEDDGQDAA